MLKYYYSREENPIGFPHWFSYTSTLTGPDATPTQEFKFKISGDMCSVRVRIIGTLSGGKAAVDFTLPVAALATYDNYEGQNGISAYNGVTVKWIPLVAYFIDTSRTEMRLNRSGEVAFDNAAIEIGGIINFIIA